MQMFDLSNVVYEKLETLVWDAIESGARTEDEIVSFVRLYDTFEPATILAMTDVVLSFILDSQPTIH